jgi:energy-converting hydrogenase Eha subunit G
MKKAPLKKVLEKISDILIELGKALMIAGFASLFLEPVKWLYAIGGIALGLILIGVGLFLTYHAETLGDDNA